MKAWIFLLLTGFNLVANAQEPAQSPQQAVPTVKQAPEPSFESYTLRQRFGLMKEKSQTFKDYKVIKESTLDGVWRIIQDSLKAKDGMLADRNQEISKLKMSMAQMDSAVKAKEASVADVVFDSTHINVLGMNFGKGIFLTAMAILFIGLIALTGFIFTRSKLLNHSLQEKKLAVNMVTHEYEEYKKRAMEKQMKLSRELQDERNKIQSMRNI